MKHCIISANFTFPSGQNEAPHRSQGARSHRQERRIDATGRADFKN
jgi:hypothetical protein